ncbi:MAG: hypothetical protein KIT08_00065 [Anaerolineales bacterium]|nr:MAG: hypothetical protein KIT08_00065 [Anaerolineales bacterium]
MLAAFEANAILRIAIAAVFTALLWLLFLQLARGHGKLPFAALGGGLLALFWAVPAALPLAFIPLLAALAWAAWRRAQAASYLPAVARIEGGGVKRGLTPPEAAVLLGRPINITLALLLFELLKKGVLRQTHGEPFTVEVDEAFCTHGLQLTAQERGERRRLAAQAINASLHKFEEPFLEIIESHPGVPVCQLDLGVAVQPLVRYVAGRAGGYSLDETRTYYDLIIDRAPKEARSDGKLTFDRERIFNRNLGWVLLGADFVSVLDQPDYSYVPQWLRKQPVALGPRTFAQWVQAVYAELDGIVDERDVKLDLGDDADAVTAALLSDIRRTTFYG